MAICESRDGARVFSGSAAEVKNRKASKWGATDLVRLDDGIGLSRFETKWPVGMTHPIRGQAVDHRPLVQTEAP